MRKMIFASQETAERMRDKVAKYRPTRRFEVYRLTSTAGSCLGFQVVEIHTCNSAMPPWPPKAAALERVRPEQKADAPNVETVTMPFAQETAAYIGVAVDGAIRWIGKSSLIAWTIEAGVATIRAPAKYLEKRGFAKVAIG